MNLDRINQLFLQFAAIYGLLWRKQLQQEQFIDFMKKSWNEALLEFDDSLLKKAVEECCKNIELPPTLPQLIEVCRGIKRRENYFKIDEEPKSTPAVAKANLAQMKQYLNF